MYLSDSEKETQFVYTKKGVDLFMQFLGSNSLPKLQESMSHNEKLKLSNVEPDLIDNRLHFFIGRFEVAGTTTLLSRHFDTN